jgi:DNA topoisomerase-1
VVDVRRRHLNAYLREVAGVPFTAKDFRTWAGTLLCASELARRHGEISAGTSTHGTRKRLVREAVRSVAAQLGNTPAVARSSYISPAVTDAFSRQRVIGCCIDPGELGAHGTTLHAAERELVQLLRAAEPRRRPTNVVRLGAGRATRPPRQGRPAGSAAKPLRRAARAAER